MNKTLNTKNSGNKKGIASKEVKSIVQELKVEGPTLMERLNEAETLMHNASEVVKSAEAELESANATEWDKDRQAKAQSDLDTAKANFKMVVESTNGLQAELDKALTDAGVDTEVENSIKNDVVTDEVKNIIATEESKEAGEVTDDIKTQEVIKEIVDDNSEVKTENVNNGLEGQSSSVAGMSVEDMRKANEEMDAQAKERADAAEAKRLVDEKALADSKLKDEEKALADAKLKEEADAADAKRLEDEKAKLDADAKKALDSKNKKILVPKAWQRVSEDGNKLINVITFMGEKRDYEVGMKHKYRFGNLSVSDGMTRIITAKFPKEDTVPNKESIEYKDYRIDIDKYGNSAVCLLKDPDGIVILEFVSLATVIDVLQEELNPDKACEISWGTIDQVIKYKRGLKSRIKNLAETDDPKRSRETKNVEVATDTSDKTEEIVTNKDQVPQEQMAQ